MRKGILLLLVASNLIYSSCFASKLDDLPKTELEKFNSFPKETQVEIRKHLNKIGNYDPDRMHLDKSGHFFVVEDPIEKIFSDNGMELPYQPLKKKVISDNPPSGYTSEGIPIFHSFPGSSNVIYLNFLGGAITGTAWNNQYGVSSFNAQRYIPAAYNPNRLPGFPPAVQQAIGAIWARVAEDYAPWQIDVTTQAPPTFTATTLVALITEDTTVDGKSMPSKGSGGVAYMDVFGFYDAAYYSPALIYYNALLNGREDLVAEVISHEIGHNFGLSHNGIVNGSPYWGGMGAGEISWGCVMGAGYYRAIVKFCNGDYPNSNNQEPQVEIITAQLPFRSPSAGNSIATATPLAINNGNFKFSGIIENYTTSNFFSLNNIEGNISIKANTFRSKVDTLGNNLCLGLRLLDVSGNTLLDNVNSQTCSQALTLNSLPRGNYFIQVYPIGNSITPFSVYGSMGQYDLIGTTSTEPLKLSPKYTTLRLANSLTFDENDTLRVSGGVPPYTFTSILNPFTKSGTTFIYRALKPGLDTITVTDANGKTASARVTISLLDFGGMYGYSWARNYPNPITGLLKCPKGYSSSIIMGTFAVDYPLYYCFRIHNDGVPADYDFGGLYSGSSAGTRVNPLTGAATCPPGYTSTQIYGESSNRPDYPAYFCYKAHDEAVQEAASFAGMYAPAYGINYNNPITGKLACPTGTITNVMLDTINVDYPLYMCTFPRTSIKISPEYTNLALNNTITFEVNDTLRVSGGTPPFTYSAKIGTFTRSGNTFTYNASKPGLDTITVTDSLGNTATAKITVGFLDFGGMYGYGVGKNFTNPTTGTMSCPSGYSSQQVMGTVGVDNPLYYCYRMHSKGIPADFDFGGMYSYSNPGLRPNPLTGGASCPEKYITAQIYGTENHNPDYPAYVCYKPHDESIEELAHFGGMYGYGYYSNYNNTATRALSCPAGWASAMMLGTYNIDYFFYFCY